MTWLKLPHNIFLGLGGKDVNISLAHQYLVLAAKKEMLIL